MFNGLWRKQVAIFCRQYIRDGWIRITPSKTIKSSGITVEITSEIPTSISVESNAICVNSKLLRWKQYRPSGLRVLSDWGRSGQPHLGSSMLMTS